MKKPPNRTSEKPSLTTVDSPLLAPGPIGSEKHVELDSDVRAALSKHLHDLLNHLWAVSARVELAMIDDSCPPEFRKTLAQLGSCAEEAMAIASQARELVSPPRR